MKQYPILTTVLFTLFCANVLLAQDVKYNYDRGADFSAYKTYQWAESKKTVNDPLLDQDIHRAIEAQLSEKGLRKVESGADLTVAYETALSREKQLDGWGMGPRWSGMGRVSTSTIDVGTLVFNVYDSSKKQLVWRGSVSKTLSPQKDPDKNYKNLEKAVTKLLRNYPPSSKRDN